jgi:hypothetical protein
MRRLAIPLLFIALAGLAGCKVIRYPAERVLPRPIPAPSAELIEELAGEEQQREEAQQEEQAVERTVRAAVERVLEIGRKMVGQREVAIDGQNHRADCSGFVRACFDAAGLTLTQAGDTGTSGTEILYNALRRAGGLHEGEIPDPGDLVFFSNTYDRNHNGRLDDDFTHVGFVESVGEDGTVHFLHFVSGAVRIGRMNLLHPNDRVDEGSGAIWNDPLRRRRKDDSAKVRYLTSQLWIGFGTVGGDDD